MSAEEEAVEADDAELVEEGSEPTSATALGPLTMAPANYPVFRCRVRAGD